MMKSFILRHFMTVVSAISIFACMPAVSNTPNGSLQPDVGSIRVDNSYFYYTEAQLALKKGEVDNAIQLLLKASELDPTSVFLDLELASLYLNQKKTAEAVLALEKGLATDPNHVEALIFYGNINRSLKQDDKAKQAYAKAIEIAFDKQPIT